MTRVVAALSGGVDSSVAAWRLREEGHEVVGLLLKHGVSAPAATKPSHKQGCCSVEDARDARAVAAVLGIPFYVLDFSAEFGAVVDEFVEEYRRGRTPNPCVTCNRDLKFGALLSFAESIGADRVATGHYAQLVDVGGNPRLTRGADRAKDQSYVLAAVEPDALGRALFPVGHLKKTEVRELARRAGLPVAEKRESQEICFVPSNDYRDLLRERGVQGSAGPIVDGAGRTLGRHGGVEGFTIGQRRGLGIAAREPLYVTALEPESGTVTVGPREDLRCAAIEADARTWFDSEPLVTPRAVAVQLRAHHVPVPARLFSSGAGVRAEFDAPVPSVAPGQLAVFYEGDLVLGSARIDRVRPTS